MSKSFTCRELGGVCDQTFSGDSLMEVMASAMPHMTSDEAHRQKVTSLSEVSGESKEEWMARMQKEFDEKTAD